MKKTLFIVALLSLTGFVKAQSLDDAIKEIRNENYLKAKKLLLTVVSNDNTGNASFYLGNVYLKLKEIDSANYYYVLSSASENAFGYLAKARYMQLKGQDSSTYKEYIEKAISQTRRKNAEVYFQIGMMAFSPEPKNVAQYIGYVKKAIDLEPENNYYPLILGDMYVNLMDGGKAITEYEKVYNADNNNVLANIRIGRIYYSAQNYDLAIQYLERANSIDPSFSIAHKELGELYFITRDYEKAAAEFKTYLSLNDNDVRTKVAYSGFLYEIKAYDKAIAEVSEFEKADTNNYNYPKILAFCYLDTKEPKKAQAYMDKFWKKVPSDKISGLDYTYAGKIASANGDTANAIVMMRKATVIDTTNASIYTEFGTALFNSDRYHEAIGIFNKRLAMLEPPSTDDYYYLGRSYYAAGQYQLADSAFGLMVNLIPSWAEGYRWRAMSMFALEKESVKGLAYDHYLKYVELASANAEANKSKLKTAYFYLAIVETLRKNNEAAKMYYNKILELYPDDKEIKEEISKLK